MLSKDKDYTLLSETEIINGLNDTKEFKLEVIGKEAGDMVAFIYGDDTTKGLNEVVWNEDYGKFNSESALKEILQEAEKWKCEVYIENIKVR